MTTELPVITEPTSDECDSLSFSEDECSRPSGFFAYSGMLCKNPRTDMELGNCETKIGSGVNLNGDFHLDASTGIVYFPGNAVPPSNLKYSMKPVTIPELDGSDRNVTDDDKNLLSGLITGTGSGTDCITYIIDVRNDGGFELILKAAEPQYDEIGYRVI